MPDAHKAARIQEELQTTEQSMESFNLRRQYANRTIPVTKSMAQSKPGLRQLQTIPSQSRFFIRPLCFFTAIVFTGVSFCARDAAQTLSMSVKTRNRER
jgi:hypothetical protein